MAAYDGQDRGQTSAYERYLAGMDASMRQKVALTAAHLLCEGRIADMGMGSGAGSHALASLYPRLEVVGVDVSPEMVSRAREHYVADNLRFAIGDIAAPIFDEASLDGIFDSSVLHHVTTFSGYSYDAARRALSVQAAELREHGVLIVRDFVDPGRETVFIDLPETDGDDTLDPVRASSARLFERFATEFRSLAERPGFELCVLDSLRPGWRRYRTTHKIAAEFVMRKDYRQDWDSEVKEEYTYFSQTEFEALFESLGLRVLASTPIHNPWIVRHRYEGKFALYSETGESLEFPPTNYVIVGERVAPGQGVRFRTAAIHSPPLGFLELAHYRRLSDDKTFDLVRRPHATLDAVPWFETDGHLFVLARMSYPRPILCVDGTEAIDGARPCHYVTEPLTLIQDDKPEAQTIEEALAEYAGIEPASIRRFEPGSVLYPSPGGIQEEVRSTFVEIAPTYVQRSIANRSGFSTSGRVSAIEAQQVLRAAHVGGLPDARLELNVYGLLQRRGLSWGPWIGEAIELADFPGPIRAARLDAGTPRRAFARGGPADRPFLELRCTHFEELDRDGRTIHERALEWVAPASHASRTLVVAVLRRVDGVVYIGVEDDDLPAAQAFTGHSNLFVAPAWRLPPSVRTDGPARRFLIERLNAEHGVECGRVFTLGGRYHPSPGVTPEVVTPFAVEVVAESPAARPLLWIPLAQAAVLVSSGDAARAPTLADGHLRLALLRAAHALSVAAPA